MMTATSGRIPASSQASSELSTASFTAVNNAFRGLSNPKRWRFLAKNSETQIARCFAAGVSAVTRAGGLRGLIGRASIVGLDVADARRSTGIRSPPWLGIEYAIAPRRAESRRFRVRRVQRTDRRDGDGPWVGPRGGAVGPGRRGARQSGR